MNENTQEFLEKHWPYYCAHLKEVAHELRLKHEAGDLAEEVLYAELLRAFSEGQDLTAEL